MKILLLIAMRLFMGFVEIILVVYACYLGYHLAQDAYYFKGFVGKTIQFLAFDKGSWIVSILVFAITVGACFFIGYFIIEFIKMLLTHAINNIWRILGYLAISFIFAPYHFTKTFIYYPIHCSIVIFKSFSWLIRISLILAWFVFLGIIIFAFYHFNLIPIIVDFCLNNYQKIITMKKLDYSYIFSFFSIFIAVDFISLGFMYLFQKFLLLIHMKAYERLEKEHLRKKQAQEERQKEYYKAYKESYQNEEKYEEEQEEEKFQSKENDKEEFLMLLQIFGLTENTFNRTNLKKSYKRLVKLFYPDLKPEHEKEEAHKKFYSISRML
ncbi:MULTISPECIES: hypothetical protein [unclassified Campylobacter]|uniref:hypothetical protein n=1 Tax=unclassified Campylobacter TaxID=2593542 RepID=UPI001237D0F1|nr:MULTISPECIES: hypothetical protein [unclassified Campylobacter]KAA6224792.1 hypothetical protein FMM54_07085 [Campylobacter sp. LR185c]KAA6228744.1 hypothetical protein FMM57_02445 [Campylobacter sp. LR286c]KAA6229554.1 hypothetical protein FMM56_08400 [Campylobacter sp. LR264d]KAA6230798.1 hypothetical protein FMM58_05155 [Campylobacter sp. LR291e]KAA8604887.1 hypothetical protein CGP82_00500 [Campylobacter sp. LR185c]